jgi:hypothetical protein
MTQRSLFDGPGLVVADHARLGTQLACVRMLLSDGEWRTLAEIKDAIPVATSEAGISARLRDLRKAKHGGHRVDRKRIAGGLYQYRLVI